MAKAGSHDQSEEGAGMTDRKETRMSESMWHALRDLIENGNTEMDRAMRALCRRGFVDAESISVTKQGRWV